MRVLCVCECIYCLCKCVCACLFLCRCVCSDTQQNSPISCDTRAHATPSSLRCCHPFHLSFNTNAFFGRTTNAQRHTHTRLIFSHSHITHTPGMSRRGHMSLLCAALLRNLIVLIAICLDRSNMIRICYVFNETLRS